MSQYLDLLTKLSYTLLYTKHTLYRGHFVDKRTKISIIGLTIYMKIKYFVINST